MQKHVQRKPQSQTTATQNPLPVTIQAPRTVQTDPVQRTYQVQVISTPPKDAWDKTATSINVLLGILGIVSIAIAVKALRKVGEQIRVAERDTQAMIRAERAWLTVDVKEVKKGEYLFVLRNAGKTPARVVSIWYRELWVPRGRELIIPPDSESGESLLSAPPRMIPPGAEQGVWYCTRAGFQMMGGGAQGEQSLFERGFGEVLMYGRVRYHDVLTTDAVAPYETRWLYWLIPQEGTIPSVYPFEFGTKYNTYT